MRSHESVTAIREIMGHAALTDCDREVLAHSVKAVHAASDSENMRLRSFRNILLGATAVMALLAVCFAVVGAHRSDTFGLVTSGTSLSGPDIAIAELLGLVSASLVGALAIRKMKGTSTAYAVPMAALLLKLPTGALTAVAGLLMVKAGHRRGRGQPHHKRPRGRLLVAVRRFAAGYYRDGGPSGPEPAEQRLVERQRLMLNRRSAWHDA